MNGALPPSSSETFFTSAAAACSTNLPTRVEPVKLTERTRLSCTRVCMAICGSPSTTLNTPAGKPASSASCAKANAEYGVSWAGLITTVQPAARAAAALRVIIAEGKFHGVSNAQTPTGSLTVPRCAPGMWLGMFCP
ncbi:hypothetical protein D3C71_1385010 [compost metagenome]